MNARPINAPAIAARKAITAMSNRRRRSVIRSHREASRAPMPAVRREERSMGRGSHVLVSQSQAIRSRAQRRPPRRKPCLTTECHANVGRQSLPLQRHRFRSEEHTSELQSLMRISYAVFCLKKTKKLQYIITHSHLTSTVKHPIRATYHT